MTDANLVSGDTTYIKANLTGFGLGAAVNADGYDGTTAYWNKSSITCNPGNGIVTITINASDKAYNYATEVSDTITSDNVAPTLSYAVMDADNDGNTYSYVDLYFSESTMNTSTYAYTDFGISLSSINPTALQNISGDLVTIKFDDKFETGDSPTISIVGSVEDLAGNALNSGAVTINTYRINMSVGWNLFSLPADPSLYIISSVLPDDFEANVNAIWNYNASTDTWAYWTNSGHDGNFKLRPGRGYWINMSSADTLVGNYDLWPIPGSTPPTVTITAQSWNLIGHWWTYNQSATTSEALNDFADSDIAAVYKYNPVGGSLTNIFDTGVMEPGQGYWLFFKGTSDKVYAP